MVNKEVSSHNHRKIIDIGNPIVLIEVENTGKSNSMREDDFRGLVVKLYLCLRSKVLLTRNQLNIGLSNSSMDIVKDIVCNDN